MKSAAPVAGSTAAIVQLAGREEAPAADDNALARAIAFAEPLLAGRPLDSGEDALGHAAGVAAILREIGAAPSMQAAAYLV